MPQSVYKITTDQGEYHITVEDDAPDSQSSVGGLVLAAARAAAPAIQQGVEAIATSPTLAANAGKVGRAVGSLAAPVGGGVAAGPVGVAMGLRDASKAGWAGGKTGYFTGKMVQDAAGPVASAIDKMAPYAKGALNTIAAAQSVLDLAQIADPNRKDIGVLGVSVGEKRSDAERKAHPALINAMADAFLKSVQKTPEIWRDVMQEITRRAQ